MALELIGGAALGAAFEKLFSATANAMNKATLFKSSLKKLEERLTSLNPMIQRIKRLNYDLNSPKEEIEKLIRILEDGEKLIHKRSEVSCFHFFKKWRYANKIEALEASLLQYFQFDLQALILLEVKSNRFSLSNRGVSSENLGSCEATDPPAFMVGLDVPLRELKRLLLNDEESRIVVSAPGGCGKTTLAKRFCHDPQVKSIPTKFLLSFLSFPFLHFSEPDI